MCSDRGGPIPDAASDFRSATPFSNVDVSSEGLDVRVAGRRLGDILEDEGNDAYSLSSSKLGFGSINPQSRREDRYCEDL